MIEKTLAAMSQGMINKLVSILEATLSKLSRYDEGSLIGSLLSFAVSAMLVIHQCINIKRLIFCVGSCRRCPEAERKWARLT